MKKKSDLRSNAFIVNLTNEEAQKLTQLAKQNEHATSTQAYLIIKHYLENVNLIDENGNTIINI